MRSDGKRYVPEPITSVADRARDVWDAEWKARKDREHLEWIAAQRRTDRIERAVYFVLIVGVVAILAGIVVLIVRHSTPAELSIIVKPTGEAGEEVQEPEPVWGSQPENLEVRIGPTERRLVPQPTTPSSSSSPASVKPDPYPGGASPE